MGQESAYWTKGIAITTSIGIGSISAYKWHHYVVRTQDPTVKESEVYDSFAIGKVTEADKTMSLITPFYTHSKVKNIGLWQDIFYDTKERYLYVIYNLKDSKGQYTKNVIEVFALEEIPASVHNNRPCYERIKAIEIDKSGTEYTKYEVESVGFDANRKLLMAVNIEGPEGSGLSDAIERITNMTF